MRSPSHSFIWNEDGLEGYENLILKAAGHQDNARCGAICSCSATKIELYRNQDTHATRMARRQEQDGMLKLNQISPVRVPEDEAQERLRAIENQNTWSKSPWLKSFSSSRNLRGKIQRYQWLKVATEAALALPPGANGLALGLCSATSLALELQRIFLPNVRARHTLLAIGGIPAAVMWLTFCMRLCLLAARGAIADELSRPRTAAAYATWGLVYCFGCERLKVISIDMARTLFMLGAVAQPFATVLFLRAVCRHKTPVEPFFNPATINPIIVTIVATSLFSTSDCHFVITSSLALASIALLLVMPAQLWTVFVLSEPANELPAEATSVAVMQAALSTTATAFAVLRRHAFFETCFHTSADAPYICVFAASLIVSWLTAYAVYRRRRAAFATLGIHHAAFTFPMCSTAMAAILYAYDPINSEAPFPLFVAMRTYSFVVAVAAMCATAFVTFGLISRALHHICALFRALDDTTLQVRLRRQLEQFTSDATCMQGPSVVATDGDTVRLPPRADDTRRSESLHAQKLLALFEPKSPSSASEGTLHLDTNSEAFAVDLLESQHSPVLHQRTSEQPSKAEVPSP